MSPISRNGCLYVENATYWAVLKKLRRQVGIATFSPNGENSPSSSQDDVRNFVIPIALSYWL